MAMGIYVISNTRNGVVYVGSAVDIDRRWAQHKAELQSRRHSNRQLQRDWSYYGPEAFNFTAVETVPQLEGLSAAEQRWIDHYIATSGLHFIYNLQLSVPQRTGPLAPVHAAPSRTANQGCITGCIAAPFELLAQLPWKYIVPCGAVGLLAVLATSVPGILYVAVNGENPPRYIGDTNVATLINLMTFTLSAVWFYVWYWRMYPPPPPESRAVVTCPFCAAVLPDAARFCPECREPRTSVRLELEREASESNVSYAWLLAEARAEDPGLAPRQSFVDRWQMLLTSRSLVVALVLFAVWIFWSNLFLFLVADFEPSTASGASTHGANVAVLAVPMADAGSLRVWTGRWVIVPGSVSDC